MRVDIFNFNLPDELIATQPANPRDTSNLLVVNGNNIFDEKFFNLPNHLKKGDLLIFNDTKVLPVRLLGYRGEAKIDATLHSKFKASTWWAFIKNSRRLKIDQEIIFEPLRDNTKDLGDFKAKVIAKDDDKGTLLEFPYSEDIFVQKLNAYGLMPLPPYIEKNRKPDASDDNKYQTVYAKNEGAVAAPTAGLHFTDNVFKHLDSKGIETAFVTLHVGAGTFLPVKVEDTKDHKMHSEFAILSQETADKIKETKQKGGRIIAVGTTSLRTLESAAQQNQNNLNSFCGETDIFITPSYKFLVVDGLITNFHLPKSTLFMLVSAFAGLDEMKNAYSYAIENKYRFYSYGDSSLLWKKD